MSKWSVNEEDEQDFEQEKIIQEWISQQSAREFEFKYINRKGNARNTTFKGISLDQKIKEDGSGTFADIIAGCDGRDLECGREPDEVDVDPKDQIESYLLCLGFAKGEIECLIKLLKKLILENKSLLPKSAIDSEW